MNIISELDSIRILDTQIMALLDLIQCATDTADMESMKTAAGMCMTLQMDVITEVDKIEQKYRGVINGEK